MREELDEMSAVLASGLVDEDERDEVACELYEFKQEFLAERDRALGIHRPEPWPRLGAIPAFLLAWAVRGRA